MGRRESGWREPRRFPEVGPSVGKEEAARPSTPQKVARRKGKTIVKLSREREHETRNILDSSQIFPVPTSAWGTKKETAKKVSDLLS